MVVGGEKLVRRDIAGSSWHQREQASMGDWIRIVGWSVVSALKSRGDLALENLALRHQLMVLGRQSGRLRFKDRDRLFWIWLRGLWPGWQRALVLVQPATVVKWHRKGFRAYWRRKSGRQRGSPRVDPQVRKLIRDMWRANPTWGKPRIKAELRKIGIEVSDSTVRRYRPPPGGPPSQMWRSFLDNHVRDIAALDFFVVPTVTFRVRRPPPGGWASPPLHPPIRCLTLPPEPPPNSPPRAHVAARSLLACASISTRHPLPHDDLGLS